MTASQAAQKVRNAFKKQGINPKGAVRVRSNDYYTEVQVDTRGIYGGDLEAIEDAINEIPTGDFDFNVG